MKNLTLTHHVLSATLLIAFTIPVAQASDLKADEVKTLFSGKTVFSYHEKKDFDIVAYYAPEGSLQMMRKGEKWSGVWRMDDKNSICLTLNDPYSGVPKKEHCAVIAQKDGVYRKYKIKPNGRRVHIITYQKFVKGNQQGL